MIGMARSNCVSQTDSLLIRRFGSRVALASVEHCVVFRIAPTAAGDSTALKQFQVEAGVHVFTATAGFSQIEIPRNHFVIPRFEIQSHEFQSNVEIPPPLLL